MAAEFDFATSPNSSVAVAFGNEILLEFPYSPTDQYYRSTNRGASYNTIVTPPAIDFVNSNGLAFGNGVFVLMHDNQDSAVSADGLTWTTQRAVPLSYNGGSSNFGDLTFDGERFIVPLSTASPSILYSYDGIVWVLLANVLPSTGWRVTRTPDGYVCTHPGQNYVSTSPDLITWTIRALPTTGINFYQGAGSIGPVVLVGDGDTGAYRLTSHDFCVSWNVENFNSDDRNNAFVIDIGGVYVCVRIRLDLNYDFESQIVETSLDGDVWETLAVADNLGGNSGIASPNFFATSLAGGGRLYGFFKPPFWTGFINCEVA